MDLTGHSIEISDRKKKLLEPGRKAILVIKVAKILAELCSSGVFFFWKVELTSDEIEYLSEELSKQSIESVAWVLLTAYSKMQNKRGELKKELLSKRKLKLKDLENSILSIM